MKTLLRFFGIRDMRAAGVARTLRGLRNGDQQDLYTGLGLAALAYLTSTRPRRLLIYGSRKAPPSSSTTVAAETPKSR
jgi:hypothetical protein